MGQPGQSLDGALEAQVTLRAEAGAGLHTRLTARQKRKVNLWKVILPLTWGEAACCSPGLARKS